MSNALGTTAAVLVGAAVVVAGVSKLARPTWVREASGLGVPVWLARPVPVVEIALGSLVLFDVARRPLAWAVAALLAAFTVVLARPLVRGQHPVCACFGAWSAKPIGPGSVVRNLVLIALAVLAAVAG